MYSLEQLRRGILNPHDGVKELHWLYHRRLLGKVGIDVMDADWDNLIILDACRYDMFSAVNTINGDLTTKLSQGSHTQEFLRSNFRDGPYWDTIYTSANPQVQKCKVERKFAKCVRLWETNWDETLRTVHPRDVRDSAIDVSEKYPHKRHIVHFIQPHYPFIGDRGKRIDQGTITGDGIITDRRDERNVWEKLEAGQLSQQTVWEAYVENLEVTLPYVEELVDQLPGKTVITSDHGNALGRRGVYGHPNRCFMKELVTVPWLIVPFDQRRETTPSEIREQSMGHSDVEDRLADLGYT
ncbi:hypothetical protein [Halosimplex halobium]|uniref:hypothetical protein n=1 Tax=Halosimplex halobium TaxID=3396618 RepID=UPI003F557B28